jgi:SNF2 family DNA or RNA helicase
MKLPALKDYQSRVISYGLKNKYSILAADPGLGKSRCAIEIREKLKLNCLIICPSYLILNWVKEINTWAIGSDVTIFTSGKSLREICDTDYAITSYDLIQKAPHLFEWADMVVLDEGHAIKSMEAKRTTFIHKHIYENSLSRVYILTGTPIKNRVQEFYSLLALCYYNPSVAETKFLDLYPSEIDFADKFSYREEYTMEIRNRYITVVKWNGIRNIDELKKWLKEKYIRIKSSEVLDLAPVTYKSVLISKTPDKSLLDSFNSFFKSEDNNSVNPTAKAEAAIRKVPFTIKYAKNLLEEVECLLIYTDHVTPAEVIAKEFGVTAITGKLNSKIRSDLADKFQSGEGKVLVATIGSMKEGKDLFRSNHMVFNDLPWVPGDMKQVVYRIQRIGQNKPCTVHTILGSPQDEYIGEVIREKIKTIEKAT